MSQNSKQPEAALDREIDLDIVSASWRSLTHSDGYAELIDAWNRKLSKVQVTDQMTLADSVLSRQLESVENLLASDIDFVATDPIEAALRETPAPAIVLSPSETVVGNNHHAQDCFDVITGMEAGRDWLRPDSFQNFEAILRCINGSGNANYAIIRCLDKSGKPFLAEAFPLEVAGHDQRYLLIRSLELDWSPEVDENLRQAFGLTQAETEICRLLFQLRELEPIAKERGVALGTVRSQLKQIFSKMEVRSKVELIRLLGLICARAGLSEKANPLGFANPLQNERLMQRKDGRVLAYAWTGAQEGIPVLYVPGAIPYFMLHSPIREALIEQNIKLIYISLPGHGHSDADKKTPFIDDAAQAIAELCDHLGLRKIAGLASYAGHVCLSKATSLRPDLFRAHLSIGLSWNLNDERLNRLPLTQRTLAKMAKVAPQVFALVCKIGLRRMKEEGPDFFLENSFSSLEADRKSIRDPEMQSLLRPACQHLVNQGSDAFVKMQSMVATTRIQDWMVNLSVPTHFLIPLDVEKQETRDFEDVSELGPLVSWEVVSDAGELLPFQTPAPFIDALAALVSEDPRQEFEARC